MIFCSLLGGGVLTAYDGILDEIYAAALDPERWRTLALRLAAFLNAPSAVIQLQSQTGTLLLGTTPNVDEPALVAYEDYYAGLDVWTAEWRRNGGGEGLFLGSELITPAAMRESEFYQDYTRHLGIFNYLGTALPTGPEAALLIAIHRPIEGADFTAEEKSRLQPLLPHLARAAKIQRALVAAGVQRDGSISSLDRLAIAILFVDQQGRIAFANRVAETLIRAGEGITARQNRVAATDPNADARLQEEILSASSFSSTVPTTNQPALRLPRRGYRPLSAVVIPLRPNRRAAHISGQTAMILVSDPEASTRQPMATLASLYGLTKAEARLLQAMIAGERIGEFADRVGISINTVRTQLKHLFAKTGTSRQGDLVRLAVTDLIPRLAERSAS